MNHTYIVQGILKNQRKNDRIIFKFDNEKEIHEIINLDEKSFVWTIRCFCNTKYVNLQKYNTSNYLEKAHTMHPLSSHRESFITQYLDDIDLKDLCHETGRDGPNSHPTLTLSDKSRIDPWWRSLTSSPWLIHVSHGITNNKKEESGSLPAPNKRPTPVHRGRDR